MPRKTFLSLPLRVRHQGASMRPRPDATENQPPHLDALARPLASMRPRPDATENPGGARRGGVPLVELQ